MLSRYSRNRMQKKMSELDVIKQRKLQELRQQQDTNQQIEQVETAIKQYFTQDALQRYGNIKAAHPEIALKLVMVLARTIQAGQLKQKIDDQTLKRILGQLTQKREIKITRR
jgi:programmed cell death protein 5